MKNWNIITPHLVMQGISLSPGAEWRPQSAGWLLIRVRSGIGYCLEQHLNKELTTGTVLVLSQKLEVSVRASQLDGMHLSYFRVVPELLTGLISLGEQAFFQSAETRRELSHQILAPNHPVSIKFKELDEGHKRRDFLIRLKMLELFTWAFGEILEQYVLAEVKPPHDARERLRQFIGQTLASEWLNLSFAELVDRMNCTPRHLSRIFREIAGMSFREKQAKIRLAHAGELLETTESKVVDVALDSGFQSLSLFNLMFRRRFGLSPGRWRKQRQNPRRKISYPRKLVLIE